MADSLSLVRPDQSYRNDRDVGCQAALGDDAAVYMVYTLEEGDDRWVVELKHVVYVHPKNEGDAIGNKPTASVPILKLLVVLAFEKLFVAIPFRTR